MHNLGRILLHHAINVVLDVGAHEGQFASTLRNDLGYAGRIISFEPMADVFARLAARAAKDGAWECHNLALGERQHSATMQVTSNSYSSSLLNPTRESIAIEPGIGVAGTMTVPVVRLDSIIPRLRLAPGDRIFLKIDTQGYERRVFRGARGLLRSVSLIQMELPFFRTYGTSRKDGPWLADDALRHMASLGWRVIDVRGGWSNDRTGEVLEADFVFARNPNPARPPGT